MRHITYIILTILTLTSSLSSCLDEDFSSSPSDNITIPTDSLLYDTVFTLIQQPTKQLKLYNHTGHDLHIDSIWIAGGNSSPFSLTVNGRTHQTVTSVDIYKGDSIYLNVNLRLQPSGSSTPILVTDSILIRCNQNLQRIRLCAAGQDVDIIDNDSLTDNITLTADKPYLIFGTLKIAPSATLTILPGARLYFHYNSGIKVYGGLNAEGTADKWITMRGDRLDDIFTDTPYDSLSRQWNGIEFITPKPCSLSHVEMRSGTNALDLWCDTTFTQSLTVSNCIIRNFGGYSIASLSADISVANTLIANSGNSALWLCGGKFKADFVTIANFANSRRNPAVDIDNIYKNIPHDITATFTSCIIDGSYTNELSLSDRDGATSPSSSFNVTFANSLLRTSNDYMSYSSECFVLEKPDVLFENTSTYPYDFSLSQGSRAINTATPSAEYTADLYGTSRSAYGVPDIGAIENTKYYE